MCFEVLSLFCSGSASVLADMEECAIDKASRSTSLSLWSGIEDMFALLLLALCVCGSDTRNRLSMLFQLFDSKVIEEGEYTCMDQCDNIHKTTRHAPNTILAYLSLVIHSS